MLLAACILLGFADSRAQVSGQVLEEGTGLPIEGAMVRTNTEQVSSGKDGVFRLEQATGADRITCSLLGYFEQTITGIQLKQQGILYLRRNYNTLAEAEVKDKGIDVNDIIQKFVKHIPNYYVPAETSLEYDFSAVLCRQTDTIADLYIPLVLRSGQEQMGYDPFCDANDTIRFRKNKLNNNWIEDYFADWKVLASSAQPLTAFRHIRYKPARYKVYVSVFNEGGRDFYDIVLITKKPSYIRYNMESLRKGYGSSKNPAANRSYVSLLNFRIDRSKHVLVNYRDISIAFNNEEQAAFFDITSRNELNDWVARAQQQEIPYYQMVASFAPVAGTDYKYVLLWRSIADNLFFPVYRGKSKAGYTLSYLWRYRQVDSSVYRSLVDFRLQNILLDVKEQEAALQKEEQQKVLRQQNVQRTFNSLLGK